MPRPKAKPPRRANAIPRPAPRRFPPWLMAGLLALAAFVLYWPALQHGFVPYDDDRYVTANSAVQSGLSVASIRWAFTHPVADNWHPLTVLSCIFVCQFWHLDPWWHHLANNLFHAANAALVFLLLRQATGAFWKSAIVAALFALHPLRVESVAWVAERKDVLSGFFGLAALIAYTRYAQDRAAGTGRPFFRSPPYWLAWLCLALGLLSKPMLVTWPCVLLLLDFWPLRRLQPGNAKILALEKVPFFLLAAAASLITYEVQQHGGVMEASAHLPLADRCENAAVSYCRYLGKMFWPTDLAVFYPHPGHWPAAEAALAAMFLAAVSAVLLIQWRRYPCLLMGWLWYLGTLIPVIGLVQVGLQAMADRYTYLPSIGVLILLVWGGEALTQRWRVPAILWGSTATAAAVACALVTRAQLEYWQDGETLFRHTVAVTENNYIALYNLGVALDDQQRVADAVPVYRSVVEMHPHFVRAHVNLGMDLDKTGHPDEAAVEYDEALRLDPGNVQAHNNLGVALFKEGKNEAATREFREAVRLAPENAGAHNSLAAALYSQGRQDEGIREFQAALRLDPSLAEAHCNFACVLLQRGQTNEAIGHFQAALRLKPDYAQARKGLAQAMGAAPAPE